MSKKVMIKWTTNDKWNDCKQSINRKDIKPFDVALEKGQWVKILFNRRWSDGEVCEAWSSSEKKIPKGNF